MIRECGEKYISLAERTGIEFNHQIPDDVVQVDGDVRQIQRAVENILDNAFKFTPAGGSVQLGLSSDSEQAVITIQDTGIGIPEDDIQNLFKRFHRGRNVVEYPGSGLGLAIVKVIIDQHQGEVEVASDESGTTVRIILRLKQDNRHDNDE